MVSQHSSNGFKVEVNALKWSQTKKLVFTSSSRLVGLAGVAEWGAFTALDVSADWQLLKTARNLLRRR